MALLATIKNIWSHSPGFLKYLYFLFGLGSYAMCVLTIFHFAVFLHAPPAPKTSSDFHADVLTDIALLAGFVFQHSLLASQPVKNLFHAGNLGFLHRCCYVLSTALVLEVVMLFWRPLHTGTIWRLEPHSSPEKIVQAVYIAGWIGVCLQTWLMDHFELFGLKQISYALQGYEDPMAEKNPSAQVLYSHYRHPMFVCVLAVLWASPIMTFDRFSLALVFTVYQLIANGIDEQDIQYVEFQLVSGFRRLRSAK